ncbi:MAG: sulfurtransferase complex subunit TusB [Pseudomonadales bacterium]|nr:sulfurtransferase complex subunit TusB [Pseudomonadales bacterium]
MILHIVNRSPFTHSALQQSLQALGDEDSIILIEDAVLLLSSPANTATLPPGDRLYVLQSDCEARGVTLNTEVATPADYARFVELVAQHSRTVSWF